MSLFEVNKEDLLVRVLERYGSQVPLQMGWRPIRCINPDHPDRRASATVSRTIGRYNCHACGLSGDGFDLMLDLEGQKPQQVLQTLDLKPGEAESEWIF